VPANANGRLRLAMDEQLIISIKEFRKLAGKKADRFSDEQIVELIIDLDFMAGLFVKQAEKAMASMIPKST
jgi:hypothetical protein